MRKLTQPEFLMIPEALLQLFLARLKVSFSHSRNYLPVPFNDNRVTSKEELITGKLVAKVIKGLSTRTPFTSTCLVKALAANKMLTKRSIPHCLHLGIKKSPQGLHAHAWLSVNNETIIGGANAGDFTEISRS